MQDGITRPRLIVARERFKWPQMRLGCCCQINEYYFPNPRMNDNIELRRRVFGSLFYAKYMYRVGTRQLLQYLFTIRKLGPDEELYAVLLKIE